MSISLAAALRQVDLQAGQIYREVVDGLQVEVRVLETDPQAEIAKHEMLLPWVEMPFSTVLTVAAQPGTLPLPDPPVIPVEE